MKTQHSIQVTASEPCATVYSRNDAFALRILLVAVLTHAEAVVAVGAAAAHVRILAAVQARRLCKKRTI